MSRLASTSLLSAQAIEAGEDPQLQAGVHLRVLTSARLGLPLAPLLVSRVTIGQSSRLGERVDVVWTDEGGRRLSPPIRLGETGPVTAWLPAAPGDPVVSAVVEMEARDEEARVEAVLSGLLGPTVIASTDRWPWQVCGTGMDRLVISGEGEVEGVRVVRAGAFSPRRAKQWRELALPVDEGFRYRGIQNAWGEAEERVLRGAPQRVGLHDDPGAPEPAACAGASPDEEFERVKFLWSERLEAVLDRLLNDTSTAPQALRMPPEEFSGTAATANFTVPALGTLLQSVLDPGVGRLAGFVDRDEDPGAEEGYVVLYFVRGAFSLQPERLGHRLTWASGEEADDPAQFPLALPRSVEEPREGRFVDRWTVAAVAIGSAWSRPQPPLVRGVEDLGWVPGLSQEERRHLAIQLGGLGPAAATALVRESPFEGLNPRLRKLFGMGPDRAMPIVCGVLEEKGVAPAASAPGEGEVHDRLAPPDAVDYRVAQCDWFGRWSKWATASAPAGVRPAVPSPVLDAAFIAPATAGDEGTLEVRCAQPREADLPPGGLPLDRLELTAQVGPGAAESLSVPAGAGGPDPLVASFSVPPLSPAEKRDLVVTGIWVDVGNRASAASLPARVQAADPRAPQALTLPNQLTYGSRPDSLGRSRVRLEWGGAPAPVRYRVYHSDETTLRERLAQMSGAEADAARAELAAASSAPDRAAVFRAHGGLFDRSCFELVNSSPLPSSGGPMSYEHELSGSLGVLAFYRVVPVSELGAEADFTACTLLPRGVPNSEPPPAPLLTVSPDAADSARALLTVTVPQGMTEPVAVRLRRSRISGADPLEMPVVANVTPAEWPAVVADAGGMPWDSSLRLSPWWTYTWRAEVQGPPVPGSSLPGAWSRASAPASLRVLPPSPGPVTGRGVAASAAGIEARFEASEPLEGAPFGTYEIEVYRRLPPGAAGDSGPVGRFEAAVVREPDDSYLVRDTAAVPAGTEYLVEVSDPLGRRGPRTSVGTL